MEIECPNCGAKRLDDQTLICSACGLVSIVLDSREPISIEKLLPGFARNIQVLLFDIPEDDYWQIRGLLSPAAGRGDEDGAAFDAESARATQVYLTKEGVPCVRVHMTKDHHSEICIIVARTPAGLKKGVRAARQTATKKRAAIKVLAPND